MLIAELIKRLQELPPDREIMILDGHNAGGFPRTINLGPCVHDISKNDQEQCADCEEIPRGTVVYVIGFGCY